MLRSQNGYLGVADYGDPQLVSNPTIPGTKIRVLGGLRKGPVAEILLHTLARVHREVRPFRSQEQGFWGYNYRAIRGATELSNHASGTAADFLAADLPIGIDITRLMTRVEITALRRIAADLDGLVRFGAFYTGRPDVMHIEVVAPERALAAYLARTPLTQSSGEAPEMNGEERTWLQGQLNYLSALLGGNAQAIAAGNQQEHANAQANAGRLIDLLEQIEGHLAQAAKDAKQDHSNSEFNAKRLNAILAHLGLPDPNYTEQS